ncbi:hypothetical protein CLOSYM_04613, partial [[Clostridium] symbiosum ATCC 14940]
KVLDFLLAGFLNLFRIRALFVNRQKGCHGSLGVKERQHPFHKGNLL